ncbi:restriction endonuclease subunit S [Anoxybacillus sp. MB8]|uniref:restriction endonuclease subunit S n=1 Tax=Anoxybacillus sp. MB8 TaxID=2496850 RepID=UPI0013D3ED23|nr:restriction endonuclease subunit S [Anoxybacillus sp. MB8]
MSKKKQKSIEELLEEALVPEEEQPYKVPENWTYFYFTSILDIQGGTQPPKSQFINEPKEGYIRLVQIRDFASDDYLTYIPYTSKLRLIEEEDILIARYGASIGRILTGLSGAYNVALAKVVYPKEHIYRKYLYWLLQTEHFQGPLKMISRSAQAGFNKNDLSNIKLPLPPYNEQKRIAEKVERLFAKIDEAKRLIEEVKESFELRRAAILDKAFKGQLGTNDPNEKSMLETSDEIKEKDIILEEEQPYKVPKNWVWVKLKSCLKNLQYGYTASSSTLEEGPKYLRITDIQNDSVDWETVPHCRIEADQLEKYKLNKGDIVIARTGATTGKSFLIDDAPCSVFASYLIRLTTNDNLNPRYLWNYLKSPMYWKQITVVKKGIAQPGANAQIIGGLAIPLPPINEQQRIAEKVNYLLSKLETEKEMVLEVEQKLELLKQSILNKAFRGELGTNDPTDEHAIELLKEVLKSK